MKKKGKNKCLVLFLFAVYMVLLVWIIIFKLQFSISELDTVRKINLIPFSYDKESGTGFHLKEVLENVAIFVPFGIYLSMLKSSSRSEKINIFLVISASLILEVTQYILAVGRTDVTDLLTNTCGGIIGIFLYWLAIKIFGSRKRIDFIITILATIVTIVIVGMLALLLVAN